MGKTDTEMLEGLEVAYKALADLVQPRGGTIAFMPGRPEAQLIQLTMVLASIVRQKLLADIAAKQAA